MNPTDESMVRDGSVQTTMGDPKGARRLLYQKLGWCMIRLQQIEWCMKWLASRTEFEVHAGVLTEQLERHEARISKQTLGSVTEVVSAGLLKPLDWEPPDDDVDGPSRAKVRLGMAVGLEDDHLESVRSRMKDLVAGRNTLVHGLIASHDIWSDEGCAAAETYVDETLSLAGAVLTELRSWTSNLEDLARIAASSEFDSILVDPPGPGT
ncbi:MAG: hypothetical protein QM779_02855 [Propionicimonas sp.]|uniref:hypothetical protein n=1 Tax=Propionicimonas sp. TaxID=1955623 RepID=UPI003D1206F0